MMPVVNTSLRFPSFSPGECTALDNREGPLYASYDGLETRTPSVLSLQTSLALLISVFPLRIT